MTYTVRVCSNCRNQVVGPLDDKTYWCSGEHTETHNPFRIESQTELLEVVPK